MAVRLRLMRIGKTKQPSYRVVAKEARTPRGGQYIEQVGFYDPLTNPTTVNFDAERLKYWLGNGAQPTETVRRLIEKHTDVPVAASARKQAAE